MKKITSIIVILILVVFVVSSYSSIATAKTPFSRTNIPAQIRITASALNVRSGPSTYYAKVGIVYNGQIVDCIGKLGNWYIVHLNNDVVGVLSGNYAKPYYPPTSQPAPAPSPAPTPSQTSPPTAAQEAQKMLDLINTERAKTGASALKMDEEVMRVAQIKAQDMVDRNYFSHTSPTYGSPFDMLKSFGISYRYAGENLAGNNTVERAHTSLMNSEGHRANILNTNYNYIGIGVADSSTYGKIYVQIYIGK